MFVFESFMLTYKHSQCLVKSYIYRLTFPLVKHNYVRLWMSERLIEFQLKRFETL
jgi:hypothetical protein